MLKFRKMHGLGNDFVILEGRDNGLSLSLEQRRQLADRHRGVGCDQLIVIERSYNFQETSFMRIYNPDGSEAGACGNAARCVAHILMTEDKVDNIVIETVGGVLNGWMAGPDQVKIDMGVPRLQWQDIPLAEKCDTLYLPLENNPSAVSMGNPHCVYFMEDETDAEAGLRTLGPATETHPLFPQKTNVEFINILSPDHIRMRVWERGAGITQACGSGACAAVVAAVRRGLTGRHVTVRLDGGDLQIEWRESDDHVFMTGPVCYVFEGEINL